MLREIMDLVVADVECGRQNVCNVTFTTCFSFVFN